MIKQHPLTDEFEAWLSETNFQYHDSHETLIDIKTNKVYSYREVFEMFLADQFLENHIPTEVIKTPSCTFTVPANDFLSDYVPPAEDDEWVNREDEAERMSGWMEREAEIRLDHQHK